MDLRVEVDILKRNLKELNKQYYDALKRIGELVEENEKLKSAAVPDLPESEKSPLSTQTKVYPSEVWVKTQMRGH